MFHLELKLLALSLLFILQISCDEVKSFAVFGYLPEYRLSNFDYDGVFTKGLTHLIYFSLEIDPETSLPSALDRLPSKFDAENARRAATKVNGRLLLSFGGNARSHGFGKMTSTKKSRKKFLRRLLFKIIIYFYQK